MDDRIIFLGLVCALPRGSCSGVSMTAVMMPAQTPAEEDLSAPGMPMSAGAKTIFIGVNQRHRWFYNSYKGLGSFKFSGVLTETRRAQRIGR